MSAGAFGVGDDPLNAGAVVSRSRVLLGIDPGFASVGLAVLPIDSDEIERFEVLRTSKSAKKAHVLATEDNLRRCREIATALDELLDELGPRLVAVCAESMSFPRSSSVAAKMAMTWGIIAATTSRRGIPILQASPQALKQSIAGRKDASKDDMRAALLRRMPSLALHEETVTRSQREHPYDALAAAVVARDGDFVRLMRRATA